MPIYEYFCKDCGNVFEEVRTTEEADDLLVCPKCWKSKTDRVISLFSCGAGHGAGASGGSCGPSRGGSFS